MSRRSREEVNALIVEALPRRVVHALHALLAAAADLHTIPTAAEALLYDVEALSAQETGVALHQASKLGFCARTAGGYWCPGARAYELRAALEDRFLAETAEP